MGIERLLLQLEQVEWKDIIHYESEGEAWLLQKTLVVLQLKKLLLQLELSKAKLGLELIEHYKTFVVL